MTELFGFKETNGELILTVYFERYRANGHSEITIPGEHDGLPVVAVGGGALRFSEPLRKVTISEGIRRIGVTAFSDCANLRSVSFPSTLEEIEEMAFDYCENLCEVKFKSNPSFGLFAFGENQKLPAEIILAGQVGSLDLAQPIGNDRLQWELNRAWDMGDYSPWFFHAGAFALAAQNDCFREITEELLDALLKYSKEHNTPEITAYFLNLKKLKFGFTGGDLDL